MGEEAGTEDRRRPRITRMGTNGWRTRDWRLETTADHADGHGWVKKRGPETRGKHESHEWARMGGGPETGDYRGSHRWTRMRREHEAQLGKPSAKAMGWVSEHRNVGRQSSGVIPPHIVASGVPRRSSKLARRAKAGVATYFRPTDRTAASVPSTNVSTE